MQILCGFNVAGKEGKEVRAETCDVQGCCDVCWAGVSLNATNLGKAEADDGDEEIVYCDRNDQDGLGMKRLGMNRRQASHAFVC